MRRGTKHSAGFLELITDAPAILIGAAPALATGWLMLALISVPLLGASYGLAQLLQGLSKSISGAFLIVALIFVLNRVYIVLTVAAQTFLTGWIAPMGCLALQGIHRLVWPRPRLAQLALASLAQGVLVSLGYLFCMVPGVAANTVMAPLGALVVWEDRDVLGCLDMTVAMTEGSRVAIVLTQIILGGASLLTNIAVFGLEGTQTPAKLPVASLLVMVTLQVVYVSLMSCVGVAAYYRLSGMDEEPPPPPPLPPPAEGAPDA